MKPLGYRMMVKCKNLLQMRLAIYRNTMLACNRSKVVFFVLI